MSKTKSKIKKCKVCGETPAQMNSIFNVRLCKECKEIPQYKLIYKTTAKQKYFLTEKDIDQLEIHETMGHNPLGKRIIVKLILESDVIDYFCAKHRINIEDLDEKLEELSDVREKRSEKIIERKEEKATIKKKELKRALRRVGLELREDSKLCEGYINGKITDQSVDDIVQRMCQMKYLYEYANMNKFMKKAYEDITADFEYCGRRRIEKGEVADHAESMALKKYGGYPKKWPWLA